MSTISKPNMNMIKVITNILGIMQIMKIKQAIATTSIKLLIDVTSLLKIGRMLLQIADKNNSKVLALNSNDLEKSRMYKAKIYLTNFFMKNSGEI